MPPSLYSSPRSRSYTNISHTVTKCASDSKRNTTDSVNVKTENARTRTLPLPPKHKRRGNLPPLQRAPSQANMHHTTVPQAIVPRKLGSRHQPTRTSLRHSRMIVCKRNSQVWPSMESAFLILCLGVAQLVLATVLTLSAIVKLAIATRPMAQDWPLYSGPTVLLTSFILLLYAWATTGKNQRIYPSHWVVRTSHSLKITSISLSSISFLFCLISYTCHLLHLLTYLPSTCFLPPPPPGWPPLSCICVSHTSLWQGGKLIYPGLICHKVEKYLPPMLVLQIIINIFSCFTSLLFIFIINFKRFNKNVANWRSPIRDESLSPMISKNQRQFA